MANKKTTTKKENKIYRLKHRKSQIVSAVTYAFLALFLLILSAIKFNAYLRGQVLDWKSSWWITALSSLVYFLLLLNSLRDIFLQLTLSKNGIWYFQFGSKKFIPWEKIERIGITRSYINGNKQYSFILKPESDENKKSFFRNSQNNQAIPLSIFVHEWFVSELRDEIKRLNPPLPMP